MVGVVGSSPIVPTKRKSRVSGHEKGDPKGSPFLLLQIFCKTSRLEEERPVQAIYIRGLGAFS